jgi:hypothetical protein
MRQPDLRELAGIFAVITIMCAGHATAADFRLYQVFSNAPDVSAVIVDFDAVSVPAKGYRIVTFYELWRTPVHGPTGDGAISEMVERFNCTDPSVRADTYVVYDRENRVIAKEPAPSVWRPIRDIKHLSEDFRQFCSADPRKGDVGPRLPGATWQQAALLTRHRLGWPTP